MSAAGTFRLHLFGPFRLIAPSGNIAVIKSKKGRALLALLALSPSGERTRGWLQHMLWSRCERNEAQSSLRRELSNLRASLADLDFSIIDVDSTCVRLRLDRCLIEPQAQCAEFGPSDLLEGLDISGEEPFEEWLRERRVAQASEKCGEIAQSADSVGSDTRLCVGVLPIVADPTDHGGSAAGDSVADNIAAALVQSGLVKVVDYRIATTLSDYLPPSRSAPDVLVSLRVWNGPEHVHLSLRVSQAVSGSLMFARTFVAERFAGAYPVAASVRLSVFINEAADQILNALFFSDGWRRNPRHLAGKLVLHAIDQMFSLCPADIEESARQLEKAYSLLKTSSILAWRAYRYVFLADEIGVIDSYQLRQEADELCKQAISMDPFNSVSLALIAHVNSFVLRRFDKAADCLDRANDLGFGHVMLYDSTSLFNFYTGNFNKARYAARLAEAYGRHLTYRYCFSTSLCMIEALSGNLSAALSYGEKSLELQPNISVRPYAPTLRYLGASYSALGDLKKAENVFSRLKSIDSNLSSARVNVKDYPTPSYNAAEFIRNGLLAVAM